MTGPGEIAAKACNKMKCKTHGEVPDVQHRNKQTLERTDAGSSKKATSVVVTLSIPKPCQVRSYFCEDHVPESMPSVGGKITSRNRRLEAMEEAVGVCHTRDATLCSAMISR
jgi:hypothetical protein